MKGRTVTEKNSVVVMVEIALAAAVLCVVGPLAIPIGPVPISLQTMLLFISVYILGTRSALVSCALYLLIGLAGLPVFTNYQGGIAKIAGPTGGYLIGYIPMVLIGGLFIALSEKYMRKVVVAVSIQFVGMVIATIVLYAFGTAWFVISTGTPVGAALGMCVIPFIPGDLIKTVAAIGLGSAVKKLIRKSYFQ
ncbi:MAG: biotin transporter BioY [Eubacterium sp.]|nr:biotin transporter BioY [Eubacterium sp.]